MRFIFLILLVSCSPRAEVKKNGNAYSLHNLSPELSEFQILDWKVGPGVKKVKVSKGFMIKVDLPQLSSSDKMLLYSQRQVDSWLIRLVRYKRSGAFEPLGDIYAPLIRKKFRGGAINASSLRNVFFRIVYAAIAPSKRFESFICPAFDHNLYIDDMSIEKSKSNYRSIVVKRGGRIRTKAQKVSLAPTQFSGGKKLEGSYGVLMALYQSKDKTLRSDWITLNERVVVEKEVEKYIRGCANFTPPDRDEGSGGGFRFGR